MATRETEQNATAGEEQTTRKQSTFERRLDGMRNDPASLEDCSKEDTSASAGSDSGHELDKTSGSSSSSSGPGSRSVSTSNASDSSFGNTDIECTDSEISFGTNGGHTTNPDESDQETDSFEDACENLTQRSCRDVTNEERGASFDLKAQLEETRQVFGFFLNNQFNRALEICIPRANEELYSGICYATLCFFKAILTMEAGDLQAASHGISRLNELAARSRRKTNVFTRFLYKPNYDQYTDEEIHAELVDAESNLLLSINSFLSDQSVIVLVRGAIKIRSCYQRYKECLYILETRTQWQSQEARRHFESGVRMGLGIFNYYMSYLPLRVIKLLQYVGFTGNRAAAIEDLDKSIALNDGLRSTLSALVVLTNLTYVEHLFGISNYDIKKVEQISEILENQYPDSAYYLIFKGRYFQMLGRMDEALKIWQRSIDVQSDWIQIHTICYWEMMWCYAARLEWAKAAEYASRLSKCSKWSHASYLYMYATFLYAQLVDEERSGQITRHSQSYEERLGEISEFMKKIPSLRVRLAGKTIPAEKFAIVRSAKFLQENNRLTIPALEYFYIWNNFVYIRNCNSELERMLERVELELEHIQSCNSNISNNYNDNHSSILSTAQDHERPQVTANSNKETTIRHDDSYLMLLIKAMCLKQLRRYVEAERVFNEIIESTDSIQEDTFIVPHAAMEFALMKLKMRQFVDAQRIIKMIRNNHSGYLHEGIVHFKLHAASRVIREQLDAISGSTHSIDLDVNTSEYNCQDLNNLENELKIKNTKGT